MYYLLEVPRETILSSAARISSHSMELKALRMSNPTATAHRLVTMRTASSVERPPGNRIVYPTTQFRKSLNVDPQTQRKQGLEDLFDVAEKAREEGEPSGFLGLRFQRSEKVSVLKHALKANSTIADRVSWTTPHIRLVIPSGPGTLSRDLYLLTASVTSAAENSGTFVAPPPSRHQEERRAEPPETRNYREIKLARCYRSFLVRASPLRRGLLIYP